MFGARRFHAMARATRTAGDWCVAVASILIARAYRALPGGWR